MLPVPLLGTGSIAMIGAALSSCSRCTRL